MSAVVIGSPLSGKKVLNKQTYQRDINGLETIVETYLVNSADRISLAPLKDVTHSAFSAATTTYPRMAVESVNFDEQSGGISALNVTYVGLTSSTSLPKPIVRMIPTTGAGIYGPPLTIEIEFVTDVTENQIATGQLTKDSVVSISAYQLNNPYIIKGPIPTTLNGLTLPSNPVPTFSKQLGLIGGYNYYGYCQDSINSERRGQFLVARIVYKEKQVGFGSPNAVASYTKI
jgi:hypothetical protein